MGLLRIGKYISLLAIVSLIPLWLCLRNTTSDYGVSASKRRIVQMRPERAIDASGNAHKIVSWTPDWVGQQKIGQVLQNRKENILRRCKKIHHDATDKVLDRQIIYYTVNLPTTELTYCKGAKCGSQFTRVIMKTLEDLGNSTAIPNQKKVKKLKFTIIRNPWARLVSVYEDKFRDNRVPNFWTEGCSKQKFTSKPSFRDFVELCVLTSSGTDINVHWMASVDRCYICTNNYNYILVTENLSNELAHMLHKEKLLRDEDSKTFVSQIRNLTMRPAEAKHRSIPLPYPDYYKQLTTEQLEKMKKYFAQETSVLGFPNTPFVKQH